MSDGLSKIRWSWESLEGIKRNRT